MEPVRILPTKFTVPFEELEGSPTAKISTEWKGITSTRIFQCKEEDSIELIKCFLGRTVIDRFDNVTTYLPHAYTDVSEWLMAYSASTKPFGKMGAMAGDQKFASYPHTIVEIYYRISGETVESIAYGNRISISETMQEASEFVTLPTEGLFWGTGGAKVPIDPLDAPGVINNLLEWTIDIRGASWIPPGVWGHPGRINDRAVTSRSFGFIFPTGTLLCGKPKLTKETSISGVFYNLSLRFRAKNNGTFASPLGWNYFPHVSETGALITYEPITDGTVAKWFYREANFSDILIP